MTESQSQANAHSHSNNDRSSTCSSDTSSDTPESGTEYGYEVDDAYMCDSYVAEFRRRRGQIKLLPAKLHQVPPEIDVIKKYSISNENFIDNLSNYSRDIESDLEIISAHWRELISCVKGWEDMMYEIENMRPNKDEIVIKRARLMFEKIIFPRKSTTKTQKVSYEGLKSELRNLTDQRRARLLEFETYWRHILDHPVWMATPTPASQSHITGVQPYAASHVYSQPQTVLSQPRPPPSSNIFCHSQASVAIQPHVTYSKQPSHGVNVSQFIQPIQTCVNGTIARDEPVLKLSQPGLLSGNVVSSGNTLNVSPNYGSPPQSHHTTLLNRPVVSSNQTTCSVNKEHALQFNAPKVEIPVFDGENEMEFPMFYDIFMATIDANPAVRPIIKFATLYNHLQGDPRRLIAGVPMTDEYYSMALTILKERYGNPVRIRHKIQHELSQIEPAHNNLDSLKHTLTLVQATVLKLRTNSLDADHFSIVQSILTKFPDEVLDQVSLFKPFSEEWSTQTLLRVLKDVIRRREEIEELSAEANTHQRFWDISRNQSPLFEESQTGESNPDDIQPQNNFRKLKGVSRWYTNEEASDELASHTQPVTPVEFAFPVNTENNLNEVSYSNKISPTSFSYECLKPVPKSNILPVIANSMRERKMRRADSFPNVSSGSDNNCSRSKHSSSKNSKFNPEENLFLTEQESAQDNTSRRSPWNSTGNGFYKQHRKHAFDSSSFTMA